MILLCLVYLVLLATALGALINGEVLLGVLLFLLLGIPGILIDKLETKARLAEEDARSAQAPR